MLVFGDGSLKSWLVRNLRQIASGIGVTPFSSILQSLMLRYWHARRTCPNCNHKWSEDLSVPLELKKVSFIPLLETHERKLDRFHNSGILF